MNNTKKTTAADDAEKATCAACGKPIMRYDDGVWFGAGMGGNYDCPSGGLHQPASQPTAALPLRVRF